MIDEVKNSKPKYNVCASCIKEITHITVREFSKTFCSTGCVIKHEEDQNVLNYFNNIESDKK